MNNESNAQPDSDPVQLIVDDMVRGGKPLRVLEAGAGDRSHVQVGPTAQVVGIDICKEQLDRNPTLVERIVGDIQTYPLEPSSFDIIFCWDVLEHLKHPERAVQNFLQALREDGLLVIGSPMVNSVKGMITKYSPEWFHVFVYKYLVGVKTAGEPSYGPFPTFMKYSMSPRSLQRLAREQRLSVEYFNVYEEKMQKRLKKKYWFINAAYRTMGPLVSVASLGHVDPKNTDFTIVMRKPATAGQRTAVAS